MKKIIFIFGATLGLCLNNFDANAQAVEQGKSLVDVYYGFPNLYTSVLKTAYANGSQDINVAIQGLGPIGMRYEYMMSDTIGIGGEFNYASSSVSWDAPDVNNVMQHYEASSPRTRIMGRFNVHFGGNDHFDGYFGVGAGYKNTQYKFTSSDPTYNASAKSLIPIAFRLAVGGRYYFTDNIGAGLELGLGGGGIINAGLAFKF